MPLNGYPANVILTILAESDEEAEQKLMEVEYLVSSISGVDGVVGEFNSGD